MENALAMEVAAYDADDQAGHGESHHQNAEEGDGQDKEKRWLNMIFLCFALSVSFVLNSLPFSFLSLLDIQKRGFILFSIVSLRLSAFFVLFQEFSGARL